MLARRLVCEHGACGSPNACADDEMKSRAQPMQVEYLKEKMWLDLYTREIEVKFIFYNGNLGTFTYVSISFGHNTFGTYNLFSPAAASVQKGGPGATRIEIGMST